MRSFLFVFLSLVVILSSQAQGMPSLVTPAAQRLAAAAQRQALLTESLVGGLPFKNIGPSVQSGRVSDLAVSPTDPTHFYVAYASGGLWETINNGTTFTPVFDHSDVLTLGAIAVDWANNILWAGTGEANSSRSSYAGLGMYRSTDGGKTWQQRGLTESHHIARILLHPTDPNTLWVAVLGHLYSPNGQRGIYKTTDGGITWEQTLFVNNDAGGIELVLDPRDPNHLYAATWERSRRAWNFVESGDGSGIYESTDGGNNWELITTENSGFPSGEGTGRIGLALTYDGDQPLLYASVDNYNRRPAEPSKTEELTKAQLNTMSSADFANLTKPLLRDYLQSNGFPKEYDVEKVKAMVASGAITPKTLVEYTESANSLLFDTEVIGLEVYKLNRKGRKWTKTHEGYLDGVYYSYGYYFGTIRVSATDPQRLYVLGVPVLRSDDGGTTWRGINAENVHSDHHALWSDPNQPGHLILGNDGGINISYDDGESWIKCNEPALGQFYYVAVDMAEPYRVYGGLQDNGVWMGAHTYEASPGWQQSGQYGYKMIGGGDGMQVAVDCRDNETVYAGSQFGNYSRMNTRTGDREFITPQHKLSERPFRWNWQTPIHLSVHNPDILYMGSNYFHRSLNQGKDFVKISADLTLGGQPGDVPYGTLSAIHESPLQFGLLYAGSDDGLVHISQDGGYSWQNISAGLPPDFWVSRVQASQYEEGRVYLALNGYRWDNWNAMLYRSDDYGQTWEIIGRNLPQEPINVVKEDPTNDQLIYVGTDHGAYVSLDQGQNFQAFRTGLPGVAVHDIVVQSRDNDIIIGTHGRSLYLASARELQAMTPAVMASKVQLFKLEHTRRGRSWGGQSWTRDNAPEMNLPVYAQAAGRATVTIAAADGPVLNTFPVDLQAGLQYLTYDFTYTKDAWPGYKKMLEGNLKEDDSLPSMEPADDGKYYLQKGKFTVTVELAGSKSEQTFEVK